MFMKIFMNMFMSTFTKVFIKKLPKMLLKIFPKIFFSSFAPLKFNKNFTAFLLLLLFSFNLRAEQIQFPEDELATESVLPVFDQPQAVRSRLVPLAKRFEVGIGVSYDLVEPFFGPYGFNVSGTYNFTEEHGINIFYNNYLQGNTNYVDQLNNIPNTSSKFNLQNAPAPKYLLLVDYQYTGFYGKLSLTKETVMNLSLFGLVGLGGYQIGDSLNPVFNFGLGQKFYFSQNSALRFDLRFNVYNGPNIVSGTISANGPAPAASSFDQRIFLGSMLSASYIYLF